jgi:N-acetylmuramoyl-L-alanine amidase-like protein
MKHAQPQGLSRRRVEQLLDNTKSERSVGKRMEVFSRHFLGCPYTINPLIGSRSIPEVFVASFDGFDCVTYMETIVALSRASNADEFDDWLRKIRYESGSVQWIRRNHYMIGWIRSNSRGKKQPVTVIAPEGVRTVVKERDLHELPGLPPGPMRFECIPKQAIRKLAPHVQTGDLIFFASTRPDHDIFHCGILVRDGKRLLLRHASRSQGGVVEQELTDFLKANRMAGVIVVRP